MITFSILVLLAELCSMRKQLAHPQLEGKAQWKILLWVSAHLVYHCGLQFFPVVTWLLHRVCTGVNVKVEMVDVNVGLILM